MTRDFLPNRCSKLILPNKFQPSIVVKAKNNKHTATKILPISVPNTEPNAICAILALLKVASGLTSPLTYSTLITTSAVIVNTTKVSINTPTIATDPCS